MRFRWILVGRLFLVLIAGGAAVAAFVFTRGRPPDEAVAHYGCPMHPQIRAAGPGECPICHMPLELLNAHPEETAVPRRQEVVDAARRRIMSREVNAPAWVEEGGAIAAVLYNDDLAALGPGDRGVFVPAVAPNAGVSVCRTAAPPLSWDRSTSRVHLRPCMRGPVRRPGEVGWLRLAARPREVLVVPYAAILEAPEGPYVLAAAADRHALSRRRVEIGRVFDGFAVVVSGLQDRELVAVRNTFFLDAERRLRGEPASTSEPMP
jgi:hypothetical protein